MTKQNNQFSFEISLSVLNHLGRNLYRSFITVLGEAISNAWDADAENVWIYINKENNSLVIKDDGNGMTADEFQNKFLKIGYSKRRDGETTTKKGRPYIGRKGIGKLALLSCADKISVLSKTKDGEYIGGVIDNSDLDQAITEDVSASQYQLGTIEREKLKEFERNHNQGTIIYFENVKEGINNRINNLKKLIALYFRFSLLYEKFNIWFNAEKITYENLSDLANKTQFLWIVNKIKDPYIDTLENVKETRIIKRDSEIKGFIASVEMPKDLKILAPEEKSGIDEEKIGIDLFVNGRLREKDILKHIPSARIVENYLYGQIHLDELDELAIDRFTSSREGIIANDSKFQALLEALKGILTEIIEDWDRWRTKIKQDGDLDNPRYSKKERKSRELFNVVSKDYSLPKKSENKGKVDLWVDELEEDAQFNISSYAECFISENLVRKYIEEKQIPLSPEAETETDKWKKAEAYNKGKANISIDIRRSNGDLSYLSMDGLANMVDKVKEPLKESGLSRDATEYKPTRDALAHTALLTDLAKNKLNTVYENIKARVRTLLSTP